MMRMEKGKFREVSVNVEEKVGDVEGMFGEVEGMVVEGKVEDVTVNVEGNAREVSVNVRVV